MKTCKTCGNVIYDNMTICPVCGTKPANQVSETKSTEPIVTTSEIPEEPAVTPVDTALEQPVMVIVEHDTGTGEVPEVPVAEEEQPDGEAAPFVIPEMPSFNAQWQDPADTFTSQPPAKKSRKGLIIFLCVVAGIAIIALIAHFAFGGNDYNPSDYETSDDYGSYDDSDDQDVTDVTSSYQLHGVNIEVPSDWTILSAEAVNMAEYGDDILSFYILDDDGLIAGVYMFTYEVDDISYLTQENSDGFFTLSNVTPIDIPVYGADGYFGSYANNDGFDYYGTLVEANGSLFHITLMVNEGALDNYDVEEYFNMPDFAAYGGPSSF